MGNQRFSITPAKAVLDLTLPDTVLRTLDVLGIYGDENGWCWPSLRTLAKQRGMTHQAVAKHIAVLEEHGYLRVYTRRDKKGARKSNQYQIRFDYPDPLSTSEVDTPSTPEVDTLSTPEVDITTQSNEPSNEKSSPKQGEHAKLFDALALVTGLDYKIRRNAGMIARTAKELNEAGRTAEEVISTYSRGCAWYSQDWRGKKNQPPTLQQVIQTIGKYAPRTVDAPASVEEQRESARRRLEEARRKRDNDAKV